MPTDLPTPTDTEMLDWLQEQGVNAIYLEDGRMIVCTLSLRYAIRRAMRIKCSGTLDFDDQREIGICDKCGGKVTDRLEDIKARHAAATPGPWHTGRTCEASSDEGRRVLSRNVVFEEDGFPHPAMTMWVYGPGGQVSADNDAAFVANSWDDVRWLISEVERLRKDQA